MARPNTGYEQKKTGLTQIAFDLFLAQGYESTTVTQITKAAGLTKAGMYHYFSSKEEILDAAIDYGMTMAIQQTRAELEGLKIREQLMCFTRGSSASNDMMEKFREYRRSHRDSYASYRIREKGIHYFIPLLEEIISNGIAAGIYDIAYPRQAAEFMVLLVRAISEDNILPAADQEGAVLRIRALLDLMKNWLGLDQQHIRSFASMFEEERHELEEERKRYAE